MENRKKVGVTCTLYHVYTKDIIGVFIETINKYAILKKDNDNNWWLVSFKFRKILRGTTYTITVFNREPKYYKGDFLFKNKWKFYSRKSFLLYEKIVWFEDTGQIPEQYIKSI